MCESDVTKRLMDLYVELSLIYTLFDGVFFLFIIRSNVEKQNSKFLRLKIMKHNDCIPPLIIKGHQLTAISQHQAAAINYLEAYKLMPENALINLCVGIIIS